ncbi:MAG: 1,4-alpha-glucan branching protein GlgB [Clostridia bacterium]
MVKTDIKLPIYLFHEGTNHEAYKLMSPQFDKETSCWTFRVWAPHAKSVSVVGNFNKWERLDNPMEKISDSVWATKIKGLKNFEIYKYSIETRLGEIILKADPYALHSETAPATASKLFLSSFEWSDKKWLKARKETDLKTSPMNVYEVHLGSWARNADGTVLNYRVMAEKLVAYVQEMNYTHIEILPITEFPYDGSWGYQVTGMYAPTSRYGTPDDFRYFVDLCHKNNIGIFLDWVVAHFPKDAYGLYEFDGENTYEYAEEWKCEHKEWGTRVFDYGKKEVKSFLISSADFWLREFHIDGIRVDAVASMLYLDYGRKSGEWKPNVFGGNYNLEAIDFLKELNTSMLYRHQGVCMIAEESTAFPLVTKPACDGGLGFNFKWNMGWMNDMLHYVSANPFFRKDMHHNITFSLTYAFSENYILPLSHDEVVHGKLSLLSKIPGEYEEKFAGLKAFYGYMMAHPGKKLIFMGGEFGQFIEWDFQKELDWFLMEYPAHKSLKKFVTKLNAYYLKNTEMYSLDYTIEGFKWVCVDDNMQNIISFMRLDKDGNYTLAVINFSPITRQLYSMGVPENKTYRVVLDSNSTEFGGKDIVKNLKYSAKDGEMHAQPYHIDMTIPGNCVLYLKPVASRDKKSDEEQDEENIAVETPKPTKATKPKK